MVQRAASMSKYIAFSKGQRGGTPLKYSIFYKQHVHFLRPFKAKMDVEYRHVVCIYIQYILTWTSTLTITNALSFRLRKIQAQWLNQFFTLNDVSGIVTSQFSC
jgi:hypothetical protein